LEIVLDEQTVRLSDVVRLVPGSRITLNNAPGAPVQIRCGTVVLFEGRVGRRKNRVAVRIEREVPRPQPNERS
jgi:flagellar motor switch protein FliM